MIFEGFQNGINLGGWISQFDKYDKAHFDSFITEKDIAYIASLGYDHVRVPVDYNVLEDEDGNIIKAEEDKIGAPASHGCIRLLDKDAEWLYRMVPDGTMVIIHPAESIFDQSLLP